MVRQECFTNRVTLMVVKGGALVHRGANVEGENSRPPIATWWCFSDARFVSFAVRFDSPVRLTGDERMLYTSLQGSERCGNSFYNVLNWHPFCPIKETSRTELVVF